MAGYINLDKGNGISLGSTSFTAISELTRDCFDRIYSKYIDEIYEAVDEGGMDILMLEELDQEGFLAFYKATKDAFAKAKASGNSIIGPQHFELVMTSWEELLEILENDSRFTNS